MYFHVTGKKCILPPHLQKRRPLSTKVYYNTIAVHKLFA